MSKIRRFMGKVGLVSSAALVAGSLASLAVPGTAFAAASTQPTTITELCAPAPGTSTCPNPIPNVYPGQNGQPADSLILQVSNDNFAPGDTITMPIEPGGALAQTGNTNTAVAYSAKPTVTVTGPFTACGGSPGGAASDTNPGLTSALITNPGDSGNFAGTNDDLVLTVNNGATGTAGDCWTVSITGIAYNVGSGAGPEAIDVGAVYNSTSSGGSGTSNFTNQPIENAKIPAATVSMTPPVGVGEGTTGNALSNYTVTETVPDVLPGQAAGFQAELFPGSSYSPTGNGLFTGTATVTATGGLTVAALNSSNACPASGSTSASVPAGTTTNYSGPGDFNGEYPFCVYGPTTTTPGSLTVSGITYTAPDTEFSHQVTLDDDGALFTSSGQPPITVIYNPTVAGFSADDTAAQAAESTYQNKSIAQVCGGTGSGYTTGTGGAVILASDAEYQDALSASFLGYVDLSSQGTQVGGTNNDNCRDNNPIVLNPPTAPATGESSTAAWGAIRKLGGSTVYIIGGTDAIDSDVATQLGQMQVGTTITGSPEFLQVIRIAGFTAEETAKDVAEYPATCNDGTSIVSCDSMSSGNGSDGVPGAFGMYNSGASESASGPAGNVPTAILADGDEFQDALAASPLAYDYALPVLLTHTTSLDSFAQEAISDMHIQLVIVMGGFDAVSDADVTTLEGMGVTVLRIAGTTFDATSTELAGFELNEFTKGPGGVPDGLDTDAVDDPTGVNYTPAGGCTSDCNPELTVGIARGDSYQDALTSAQVLGWGTVEPLLLNTNTSTPGPAVAAFLSANGKSPNGGLREYETASDTVGIVENIRGLDVFGGTFAQTPGLIQSELNDIAAG